MANGRVKRKEKRVKLNHRPYSKGLQFKSIQDKAGDQTIPLSLAALMSKMNILTQSCSI